MVCVGETVTDPEATEDWFPIPLSMLNDSAPLVLQFKVEDCPGVIAGGFAWKRSVNSLATVTVTLTGSDVPPGPVAVAV